MEIPEGLSFNYRDTERTNTTTEQIERFMCDYSKDFEQDK